MKVLFIYGPVAAGKYTIATLVSEALQWRLFHNHLVVDAVTALFEFGTPGFKQLRAQMWLSAFQVAANENESFVFTFNPENSVDPDLIKQMEYQVIKHGGEIHYIELQCDDELLVSRMNSKSRQKFNKLTDPKLYLELKSQGCFDFPDFCQPSLALDSGKLSAEESAKLIMKWFNSNRQ